MRSRRIDLGRWRGTPRDLLDLGQAARRAIEEHSSGAKLSTSLEVANDAWSPASDDEFLDALDAKAVTQLREATLRASKGNSYAVTITLTHDRLSAALQGPGEMFLAAMTQVLEDQVSRRRPPSNLWIPRLLYALAGLAGLAPFYVLARRGADASLIAVFWPLIVGVLISIVAGVIRERMPNVELVPPGNENFAWERFRGRVARSALWLIPILIGVFFSLASYETENDQLTAEREVDFLFAGFGLADNDFWVAPPRMSPESREYLKANWDANTLYLRHDEDPETIRSAQRVDFDDLYNGTRFDGQVVSIRGFVTVDVKGDADASGGISHDFEIAVRGESARAWCGASLEPDTPDLEQREVRVAGVAVARGDRQLDRPDTSTPVTYLVCPQVQLIK